jgi:hypothetical protein
MGFDLGVALGAAANSGLNTYTTITKLRQEQEKEARDAARFAEEQKAWEERNASNKLMQEAYKGPNEATGKTYDQALQGMNRTDIGGTAMTPEARTELTQSLSALPAGQAQAALRAYGSAYGGSPEASVYQGKNGAFVLDKAYDPAVAFEEAAAKSGNPTAFKEARANRAQALQIAGGEQTLKKGDYELKGLARSAAFDTKFENVMDSLHTDMTKKVDAAQTLAERDDMNGLVKTFGPELKKAYGHDVALVGNNIVVKDAKGKTIKTISNTQDALSALDDHFKTTFGSEMESRMLSQGLFKTPQELHSYLNNKEQIALKGREVAAKEAVIPSEIAKNQSAANMSNAHAGVFAQLLKAGEDNKAAGTAMKPYLDQIAALDPNDDNYNTKINQLTTQAAVAGATKSKDLTQLVAQLRKPERTMTPEYEKAAYVDLGNATTPEQIKLVHAKWPLAFGPSKTDKAIEAASARRATEQNGANAKGKTEIKDTPSAIPVRAAVNPTELSQYARNTGDYVSRMKVQAKSDPDLAKLESDRTQALRMGSAHKATEIGLQIESLLSSRYNLTPRGFVSDSNRISNQ